MNRSAAQRYLRGSLVVAALASVGLAVWVAATDARPLWVAAGAVPMLAVGTFGGAAVARRLGTPGPAFLAATIACMMARLGVAFVGVLAVRILAGEATGATGANGATPPFLVGLAASFLIMQAYEIAWFYREGWQRRLAG